VIALGTNIESELIAGGVDRAKVFVVPNGVDLEEFRPSGAGRQGLIPGLDTSRPTIGYISNLGEREGHVVLVEAVAELRQRGVPVNCVIVGDGPMRPAIESAVANQNLEGQVFVTGPVPHAEVKDYYACLDVFVVPRLDDRAARYTTPLKPFEAMAMRIPLIVSDLPALVEIVGEGGERGKAFYCGSSSSLADRIQETLADSEKTSLVVDEAHRWVREERQWAHNAPRYREAFEAASATRL
jgi:glycosyltransferase involved in cell wall biosynthesis